MRTFLSVPPDASKNGLYLFQSMLSISAPVGGTSKAGAEVGWVREVGALRSDGDRRSNIRIVPSLAQEARMSKWWGLKSAW